MKIAQLNQSQNYRPAFSAQIDAPEEFWTEMRGQYFNPDITTYISQITNPEVCPDKVVVLRRQGDQFLAHIKPIANTQVEGEKIVDKKFASWRWLLAQTAEKLTNGVNDLQGFIKSNRIIAPKALWRGISMTDSGTKAALFEIDAFCRNNGSVIVLSQEGNRSFVHLKPAANTQIRGQEIVSLDFATGRTLLGQTAEALTSGVESFSKLVEAAKFKRP